MKKALIGIISAMLLSPYTAFAQSDLLPDIEEFPVLDYEADDYIELFADAEVWDGTSTQAVSPDEQGVYHITNAAQLAWLSDYINADGSDGMYKKTVSLDADIDLGGQSWVPIGAYTAHPFVGTFLGNGHTVSGLNFDATSYNDAGLFGSVLGNIEGLKVVTVEQGIDTQLSEKNNAIGILAGSVDSRKFAYNEHVLTGSITDCSVSGKLTVNNSSIGLPYYVGGVVGKTGAETVVKACIANAEISALTTVDLNGADEAFVGALTGANYGTLEGVSAGENAAAFAKSANPAVGGVCGFNVGVMRGCTSKAALAFEKTASSYDSYQYISTAGFTKGGANLGGIAGRSCGTVIDCVYNKDINLSGFSVNADAKVNAGGIVGFNSGTVTASKADGSITANLAANTINLGSIAGRSISETKDSVSDIRDCRGGMSLDASSDTATVNLGGIVGESYSLIYGSKTGSENGANAVSIKSPAAVSVNLGGIAGISGGKISGDVVDENVSVSGRGDDKNYSVVSYAGGIVGTGYGDIYMCESKGSVSLNAANSYAGGIAGRLAYDRRYSGLVSAPVEDTDENADSRAALEKSASYAKVSGANVAGLCANLAYADVSQCLAGGELSGNLAVGMVISAREFKLSDCSMTAKLAKSADGKTYLLLHTANGDAAKNVLKNLYLAPISDANDQTVLPNMDAVTISDYFCAGDFSLDKAAAFDFYNVWAIDNGAPVLRTHTDGYSTSSAALSDYNANRLYFRAELENPVVGERVYIALYDKQGRFKDAISGLCVASEDDKTAQSNLVINYSNTAAYADLEYSYMYWTFTDFYDPDTWAPAEDIPVSYKVFTWAKDGSMKPVSGAKSIDIVYEASKVE